MEAYEKQILSPLTLFVPMSFKPQLDYYWILKEKWFWCAEQDWENYMRCVEQLDKLFEKK